MMVILKCYYNFDLKEYVIKYVFIGPSVAAMDVKCCL